MKNLVFACLILLFSLSTRAADNQEIFTLDENKLKIEMASLEKLENYIVESESLMGINELSPEGLLLVKEAGIDGKDKDPKEKGGGWKFDWGSFGIGVASGCLLSGCILFVYGYILVAGTY